MHPGTDKPDLSIYTNLIDEFVAGVMSAKDFSLNYLREQQHERRFLGAPWYEVLQDLFAASDYYVAYPELRTEPDDLDDDQLKQHAQLARARLRALGIP